MMKRVLLTDGQERSTLAVTRALGAAGHWVEVASHDGRSLAGASRYCAADHRAPTASDGPLAFLDHFESLVAERGIEVFIPMTDVSASVGLGLRERCPDLLIPFPPAKTWDDASDKARLAEVAEGLGVPVPRQVRVESKGVGLTPVLTCASEFGYPVVVKPHRSAVVLDGSVEKLGVRMAGSPEELDAVLGALPPHAFPVLVQERIKGPGLGGFFLCRQGDTVAAFAHRRLREKPPTGGVSVLRESAPLRDDLRRYSEALLGHLGWSGVAMVEFKEDAATGTPYLMEINGRFWGSLQLAVDAGVDFPRLLLEHVDTEDSGAAMTGRGPTYREGIQCRWLWGDVDHLIAILRSPPLAVASGLRPGRVRALVRFLTPAGQGRWLEVLRREDLRPFIRETISWIVSLFRK